MSPHESLLGYLFGGGLLFLIAVVYQKIRNEEGMGGGDVKLLAMIGAFIGWKGVFFTIFVASMAGTLAAIVQKLCTIMFLKKVEPADQSLSFLKMRIPFGPFLAIGAISYLFFGHQLIHWYLKTVR
jgi:leader peptidase (prepilin peptidase)/N-methyltransferase